MVRSNAPLNAQPNVRSNVQRDEERAASVRERRLVGWRGDGGELDARLQLKLVREAELKAQIDTELDSGVVPPRIHMRGDAPLMMNRLAASPTPTGQPDGEISLPTEVTHKELQWYRPHRKQARRDIDGTC